MRRCFLILCWALYDLSNQFFALNIVSLYFVRWLIIEKKVPEIFYSVSFSISMLLVAALAPFLGYISDLTRKHRIFLIYLTLLSIIFTMLLGFTQSILVALVFFAVANFGCQMGIVFYNALMVNITPLNKTGLISGLGKMFGYTGAILSLYLIKPIVLKEGYQATFVPTGLLFLIFSLPCLIFVKDKLPEKNMGLLHFLRKDNLIPIFKTVKPAIFNTYKAPGISEFLKSAFFGLASVNAVILFMSVYATRVFNLNEVQVINLIAFSTFFAIFGSIFSGFISDFLGYKLSLALVYILWIICFSSGALVRNTNLYFIVGALTGFSLGSTWVISRALAISLVPEDKTAEVFGLFNLVGYLSGILGAIFWGLILLAFGSWGEASYRLALMSLNLFMFLGLYFLLRMPNGVYSGRVSSASRSYTS